MSLPHTTAFITLGGTISTAGSDRLDFGDYMYSGAQLSMSEKVADLARLSSSQRVVCTPLLSKPSHDINGDDWIALARLADRLVARDDIDSVVVSQGTNTLEETAFFLELLLATTKPVVVVGSMRPAGVFGSDSETSIVDGLRVARSPRAVGVSVLVSIGGCIFEAADLTKSNTRSLNGFTAPRLGPIGSVEPDGKVVLDRRHDRPLSRLADPQQLSALARVDLVTSHVDADGTLIRASVAAGASGIVSAGTGAGFPTAAEREALISASQNGVVICQASRCPAGYVVASRTAEGASDFVWANHLLSWQARAFLSIALTQNHQREELQRLLDLY